MNAGVEEVIHLRSSHHDQEDHDHHHDAFQSFALTLVSTELETLIGICKSLIVEFPVLRLKGFAAIPGKPMRVVIQGVGQRLEHYYDRPWHADENKQTQLVLIGKDLHERQVKSRLDELMNHALHASA
jgi:cobalamin biosynthesis protein CobW